MRINIAITSSSRHPLRATWLAGALLVAGSLPTFGQTQNSPVGTWDCVMSGSREGLAIMTFFDNLTFTNHEILVPKKHTGNTEVGRNDTGDTGRTPEPGTPAPPRGTNIFGWESTGGRWGFDSQGRVIGYFVETSKIICTTNTVPLVTNISFSSVPVFETNIFDGNVFCITQPVATNETGIVANQTVCYTNQVGCSALTNRVSFTGKAVTNTRLNLQATGTPGKTTYSGVPQTPLTDISGSYYGIKRVSGGYSVEFFTVEPRGDLLNFYDVVGEGPGYSYQGVALLSSRKKLAFTLGLDPDGAVVRSVIGPFNVNKMKGELHGLEQPDNETRPRIKFNVVRQAPLE